MKGLLLKDFYQAWKYGKIVFLLIFLFAFFGLAGNTSLFVLAYPCVFSCNLVMTLITYDENAHWDSYALCLPYTRKDLVTVKYLLGLFLGFFLTTLMLLTRGIGMAWKGSFYLKEILSLVPVLLAMSFLPMAIQFFTIYRFGISKGRLVFLGFVALTFAFAYGLFDLFADVFRLSRPIPAFVLGFASLGVYGVSWLLSVRVYEKKDL